MCRTSTLDGPRPSILGERVLNIILCALDLPAQCLFRVASMGDAILCGRSIEQLLANRQKGDSKARRSQLGLPTMRTVAVSSALRRLVDTRAQIRCEALNGLAKLACRGDAQVISKLLRCIQSPHASICCDALKSLPKYAYGNDGEVLAAVVNCLWDNHRSVRSAGEMAICELAANASERAPELIIGFLGRNLRSHTCGIHQYSALQVLLQIVEVGGANATAAVMEHLGPGYLTTISRIKAEKQAAIAAKANPLEESDSDLSDASWADFDN